MRVELSKALSILSHEVRGSLGVLQGYLRMLRDGVSDPALSARMLQSMQDATTRLAAVAREASDLSAWTEGRRPEGRERVPIGQLLEQAVAGADVTDASVIVPAEHAGALVVSDPPGALARALSAVLVASRRESVTAAFTLTVVPGSDGGEIVIRMSPTADGAAEPGAVEAPFDFGRGGMGLSLVLASHVLDTHGARLTSASGDRSRVTVRLQRDGGSQ
jgi:signal transduction histidine kinase